MSSIREIKQAVEQLTPADFSAFRQWFDEYDAGVWDRRFEQDIAKGRLDELADEAVRDLKEGRCSNL